jgi:hypothetical protein
MSHETTISDTDDIGMICVKPSVGKYSIPSTSSFINCLAEFDNEPEAEQFSHDWSEASGSKERRKQIMDLHAVKHPDYARLGGTMLDEYIDYYFEEWGKVIKREGL